MVAFKLSLFENYNQTATARNNASDSTRSAVTNDHNLIYKNNKNITFNGSKRSFRRMKTMLVTTAVVAVLAMLITPTVAESTTCSQDCQECLDSETCTICENSMYLHKGACYDSCAFFPGYRTVGDGVTNRRCDLNCGQGFYDSTASSSTPTCKTLKVCESGHVEIEAPTPASNRKCKSLIFGHCGDMTDCQYDQLELGYRGVINTTVSGRTCQAWSSQSPHSHSRTSQNYPEAGLGDHNYCRNPDGEYGGPWCYTTDSDREWEHCDVCRNYVDLSSAPDYDCHRASTDCVFPAFETGLPTWSSDRGCGRNVKYCTVEEFQTIPFTATTDRQCTTLRTCDAPEFYDAVAATPTTDRSCARVRPECATTDYESQAATQSSDRECDTVTTVCPIGQETSRVPTTTSDRECSDCQAGFFSVVESAQPCVSASSCNATHEFITAVSTPTSDTTCEDLHTCADDEYATIRPTPTSNRGGCTMSQVCVAGTQKSTPLSMYSDQECEACPDGFFKATESNDDRCKKHLDCLPTQFESLAPSSTSDRGCENLTDCDFELEFESKTETVTSDRECSSLQECGLGEFIFRPATPTSNRFCAVYSAVCSLDTQFELTPPTPSANRRCRALTHCNRTCTNSGDEGFNYEQGAIGEGCSCPENCKSCSTSLVCLVCSNGKSLLNGRCVDSCQAATQGQFIPVGTIDVDRTCCGVRDFECRKGNHEQPPADQYESIPPTPISDRECASLEKKCSSEEYQSAPSTLTSDITCTTAKECADVGVEYEVSPPEGTSNRVCNVVEPCDQGEFAIKQPTSTEDFVCQDCNVCGQGQFVTEACSDTEDTVCGGCGGCTPNAQDRDLATYVSDPCTLDHDDVCSPCKRCTDDTYQRSRCDYLQNTECIDCETCANDEYETVACSENSNRECASVTTCEDDTEFESEAPTTTTNRKCLPITYCGEDEHQLAAATATANTKCKQNLKCGHACENGDSFYGACQCGFPCLSCVVGQFGDRSTCTKCPLSMVLRSSGCSDNCAADEDEVFLPEFGRTCQPSSSDETTVPNVAYMLEFQTVAPTSTSDRICNLMRECTDTQYQTNPGTTTTDRGCNTLRECDSDKEFEAWPASPTSNRICGPLTRCDFPTEFETVPKTATSDRSCQNVRGPCDADEFIVRAETPTSDRECLEVTTCVVGAEYEVVPPAEQSNRLCAAFDVCDVATEYQTQQGTTTTNRQCEALSLACVLGDTFQALAPTTTTNRQCVGLTPCVDNVAYQSIAATITSDRECTNIKVCDSLTEFESEPSTFTSNRACTLLRECDEDDEWQSSAPTLTTNRVCLVVRECTLSETFEIQSPTTNSDRECQGVRSPCGAEDYESAAATLTSDRECSPYQGICPQEFWEARAPTDYSDRSCLAATKCVVGVTYETKALGNSTDRDCGAVRGACDGVDEYEFRPPSLKNDRECQPLLTCNSATEFESKPPTATTNRVCRGTLDCVDQVTFESATATATTDRECTACGTCEGNTFVAQACTTTSNTGCEECGECADYQWMEADCSVMANSVCTNCTVCLASQYLVRACDTDRDASCVGISDECLDTEFESKPPSPTSDRKCLPRPECSDGKFQVAAGVVEEGYQPLCINWAQCNANAYESVTPTAYQNRACKNCSVCADDEITIVECSSTDDTVCSKVEDCSNRCELSDGACTDVLESCSSFKSSSTCPLGRCQFKNDRCMDSPDTVTEFSCPLLDASSCVGECAWDVYDRTCRAKGCEDVYTQTQCTELGCTFESHLFYCHPENEAIPCNRLLSKDQCLASDSQCYYNDKLSQCVGVNDCSRLSAGGNESCSAIPGCVFDPLASYCRQQAESTPCQEFEAESCPVMGKEYAISIGQQNVCTHLSTCLIDGTEYQRLPSSPTSDRVCDVVTTCAESEFMVAALTATTDRMCNQSSVCTSEEFETAPLQITMDRDCQQLDTCTPNEFESEQHTPTSDRICTTLRECDLNLMYYNVPETPTTDRECRNLTLPCELPLAIQSVGKTDSSDRVCDEPVDDLGIPGQLRVSFRNESEADWNFFDSGVAFTDFVKAFEANFANQLQGTYVKVTINAARTKEDDTGGRLLRYNAIAAATRAEEVNAIMSSFDETSRRARRNELEEEGQPVGSVFAELVKINADKYSLLELGPPRCTVRQFLNTSVLRRGFVYPMCEGLTPECNVVGFEEEPEDPELDEGSGSGSDLMNETLEFESVAPTRTSDRVCQMLDPTCAEEFQFEKVQPTPSSNRICQALTSCSFPREYESQVPTYSSDRECTNTTICDDNPQVEFESMDATTTSNRECVKTTAPCDSDSFEFATPTRTTDRDCKACSIKCDFEPYSSATHFLSGDCTRAAIDVCSVIQDCDYDKTFQASAPTWSSQRVCDSLKQCNFDSQFISKAKTTTTNRVCSDLLECKSNQFQSVAATTTTNRECEYISLKCLSSSDYISTAATNVSDIRCSPISVECHLQGNFWQSMAATISSDRVCVNVTQCEPSPDEYQLLPATNTTDQECGNCSTCDDVGIFFKQQCSSTIDAECEVCSECDAGNYTLVPCLSDTNTVCGPCTPCESGYFENATCVGTSDTQCSKCKVCDAGEFVTTNCSTQKDTECTAFTPCDSDSQYECAEGTTFFDRECCAVKVCSDLEYVSANHTATTNAICALTQVCEESTQYESAAPTPFEDRQCEPITICDQDTEYRVSRSTRTSNTECETLAVCQVDEYEAIEPTLDSDRECLPQVVCNNKDQYQIRDGTAFRTRICGIVTECTLAIEFETLAPTPTSDRFCDDLAVCQTESQWEDVAATATSDRECLPLTVCESGLEYASIAATPTSNRTCTTLRLCIDDEFELIAATATSNRQCQNVIDCDDNQVETVQPTATSDRLCVNITATTTLGPMLGAIETSSIAATPFWIGGAVALFVIAIAAIVIVSNKRKNDKSSRLEKDRGRLPYVVSSIPEHEIINTSFVGSIEKFDEPSFVGSIGSPLAGYGERFDVPDQDASPMQPKEWLLGTVPLAHETGSVRAVQEKYLNLHSKDASIDFEELKDSQPAWNASLRIPGKQASLGGSEIANVLEIPNFPQPYRFVTTKHPLDQHVGHFWQFVWDMEIECISVISDVNLTHETFIDTMGSRANYSSSGKSFEVTLLRCTRHGGHVLRELNVMCDGSARLIQHFQFVSFPDGGVPSTPIEFGEFVKACNESTASRKTVVHCYDGTGACGVFMLAAIMTNKLQVGMVPDAQAILGLLRSQQPDLVASLRQYQFAIAAVRSVFETMGPLLDASTLDSSSLS